MKKLQGWRRRIRYRLCWLRFHEVVSDQVIWGWREPDRLMPDGSIKAGDEITMTTVKCLTCGKI